MPACEVMEPIRSRSPEWVLLLAEVPALLGGTRACRMIVRAKLMSDGRARGPSVVKNTYTVYKGKSEMTLRIITCQWDKVLGKRPIPAAFSQIYH